MEIIRVNSREELDFLYEDNALTVVGLCEEAILDLCNMDERKKDGYIWDYYRDKFSKLADRLAEQIGYDYDKQMEKCLKKMGKKEKSDDVGEDAMALAVKRGKK